MSNRNLKAQHLLRLFQLLCRCFFSSFHTVCCDFFKSLPWFKTSITCPSNWQIFWAMGNDKGISFRGKGMADQWLSMLANGTCWLGIGPRLFRRVLMMWLTGGKAIGVFWPRFDLISSSLFFFSETTDYCSGVTCAPHAPLSMLQPRDVHMLIRLS